MVVICLSILVGLFLKLVHFYIYLLGVHIKITRLTRGAGRPWPPFQSGEPFHYLPNDFARSHGPGMHSIIGLCYYTAVLLQRHARVDAIKVWTPEPEKIVTWLVLSSLRTFSTLGKPV